MCLCRFEPSLEPGTRWMKLWCCACHVRWQRVDSSLYMLLCLSLGSNCWNLPVLGSSWHLYSWFLSHFFIIFFTILFIHSNSCFFFYFISFTLYFSLSLSIFLRRSEFLQKVFCEVHLAVPGWVWGERSSSWNPNPNQVPPADSIFDFFFFGFLLCLPFDRKL